MQPFDDGGKFDKRFKDVFQPALKDAGLEAYRVDKDSSVDVLIEAIESGIRESAICLADITTDQPNVWYELGYAFASGCDVILVCSKERKGQFPFDIQHRLVTQYEVDSISDYRKLRREITERAMALRKKAVTAKQAINSEQIATSDGLSPFEISVLTLLAGETTIPSRHVGIGLLQLNAERAGLTKVGFALAYQRLERKGLVVTSEERDGFYEYLAATVSSDGWGWLEENKSLLKMLRTEANLEYEELDDDIPF